ncbi:MAG: GDSL-type esterase/lipase family protein [Bacteroidales bacterium]|nr:GDSL-type esterase/lipase family protein [Bacteroidales bacterium]
MKTFKINLLVLFLFSNFIIHAQIKVACIGNSITYGAGIEHRDSLSYPAQMSRILGKNWQVENFGVSGATLLKNGDKPYWKLTRMAEAMAFNPDAVVIKLGTNDSKPQNWKYKDEYIKDYLTLIDTLRALPSHPIIFVCLPAPAYGSRWGINDSIIQVDVIPMVKSVAKQRKLEIINLNKLLANQPELFPDLIHPNAKGAGVMAEKIAKVLKKSKRKIEKNTKKNK